MLLVARTWMTWLQPTVDSGRELVVPARVAAGERLYADVVAHYGPVPAWLHAAAYRAAGLRFTTPLLLLVPLAALALLSLVSLGRRAGEGAGASWGAALGLAIALVAPNGGALVFPYSFAAAHALAFSSAALALAFTPGRAAAASSLLWGLALASKPELALASLAAALAAAFVAATAGQAAEARRIARFAAGGVAAGALPWALALRGLDLASLRLEGPLVLFSPPAEWRRVYATVSGFADLPGSASWAVTSAALAALLLASAAAAERLRPRSPRTVAALEVVLPLASVAALLHTETGRLLDRASPPLLFCAPPLLLGTAAWLVLGRRHAAGAGATESVPASRPAPVALVALVALVSFAALVSLRVLFGMLYGWAATPYAALAALPVAVASGVVLFRLFSGRTRALAWIFASLVLLQSGRIWIGAAPSRFARVETPRGTVRLPAATAPVFRETLAFLAARARPGDELAGFPEEGFFSFALGIPNALRQDQLLPGHLDAAAEEATARRLAERLPRFVLLANQPSAAFGPVSFGRDYATRLFSEVERRYRPVAFFGEGPPDAPVGFGPFFVRVYERNGAEASPLPGGHASPPLPGPPSATRP